MKNACHIIHIYNAKKQAELSYVVRHQESGCPGISWWGSKTDEQNVSILGCW